MVLGPPHCHRDPPQRSRPPLHHHPPWRDAYGLRPSAPGFVGCRVRGARSAPLRVGAALGPAAPRGDRADSGMGVRRDQDVSVPSGGWPCHGCGKRVERSRSARRICCRPGGSGGACRRTRAWCRGLCDQGRAGGGSRTGGRERRQARVPLAARTAPGCDSRTRPRGSAVAKRDLLVGLRLLRAVGHLVCTAQQALHKCLMSGGCHPHPRRPSTDRYRSATFVPESRKKPWPTCPPGLGSFVALLRAGSRPAAEGSSP